MQVIRIIVLLLGLQVSLQAQQPISLTYDINDTKQTIRNFAASDAWAGQFVGNWPEPKKNTIADWLFSMDTLADGSPKGIGLSMWRYNIGAGSVGQVDSSGIKDEWRRAAAFTDKDTASVNRIRAQNWFMQAAKQRGVKQFLGFFNSPPVSMTVNGKAFATKAQCNINDDQFDAYAAYAVKAYGAIKKATGIGLNYISPVNEPQWDWSDGGQEGCPYNNAQISSVAKAFAKLFAKAKIPAQLLLTESGHHKYLFDASDKPEKDDQINDFFGAGAVNYVGDQKGIVKAIASHSYFSTSPAKDAIELRTHIATAVKAIPGLEFWQSEYCILGDNAGEINGSRRDTGMTAALYIAKVMHYDLVYANAAAWHWWLAISPYNYKDGLVYIDRNKWDGNYYGSKMLWAMGNYSRFVRPGMQRIEVKAGDLMASAYKDARQVVIVLVNANAKEQVISLPDENVTTYITDKSSALKKRFVAGGQVILPAESVVTVIIENRN